MKENKTIEDMKPRNESTSEKLSNIDLERLSESEKEISKLKSEIISDETNKTIEAINKIIFDKIKEFSVLYWETQPDLSTINDFWLEAIEESIKQARKEERALLREKIEKYGKNATKVKEAWKSITIRVEDILKILE